MLFKPSNPMNVMWDTWLLAQPGTPTPFYLNYLSNCDASCGGPVGGWNGVGAAISTDGVHFADEGVVIHKDAGAVWLGSGSVLKNAAGEYVMNFSEEYDCDHANGCQSIFFATSPDLKTWTRVPDMVPGVNDSNVFKYGPGYKKGGRWDCIATVPKPGAPGEFIGYWTATPDAGVGAGVGETTDATGYHWRALPPITAGFPAGEVGSVIVLGGRYYMLFGGGHLYVSANATAGFALDRVNPAFHADGDGPRRLSSAPRLLLHASLPICRRLLHAAVERAGRGRPCAADAPGGADGQHEEGRVDGANQAGAWVERFT